MLSCGGKKALHPPHPMIVSDSKDQHDEGEKSFSFSFFYPASSFLPCHFYLPAIVV